VVSELEQRVVEAAAPTPGEREELSRVALALFGAEAMPSFGRHRVIRQLGRGGVGVVYLAHDPELDRPVAVKSIARTLGAAMHAHDRARMRREAQALARLRHPNVVAVHDVDVDADPMFLVMEYIDGPTLSQRARTETRRRSEIVAVIADAGRGLAAAHAAGIAHRDVKPSNILVDVTGVARVVDFGLAWAQASSAAPGSGSIAPVGLTATGALLGTPAYMAPEQFLGAAVDGRTDQWGLAVTCFELLAGGRAFAGDDVTALRDAVLAGRLATARGIPSRVMAVLRRALAIDPARRHPDMDAFVDALVTANRFPRGPLVAVGAIAAAVVAGTVAASASSPVGAIAVGELRAAWATPEHVRWQWRAEGSPDALRAFELTTCPRERDVIDGTGPGCRVFTHRDNPELGHFLLPRTGGVEPVVATTTDGHPPEREVFARLCAIDTAGLRSCTDPAGVLTAVAPVDAITVFDEERPRGFPLPAELELAEDAPFNGARHLQFTSRCATEDCYANLRWQGLDVALDRLGPGSVATTAYLELAVAVDGGSTSWWSQLRLWYGDVPIDDVVHFAPFALRRDGRYRVLQVPLRVFAGRGGAVVDTSMTRLHEFGLGGWWPAGAVVRIDDVRIRW
jgi:predicted Ser/Thr protein kinase